MKYEKRITSAVLVLSSLLAMFWPILRELQHKLQLVCHVPLISGGERLNKADSIFIKITSCYICALLTLYLFFCGTNGYQGVVRAKFLVFCVLCGGYILLMGVLGIECVLIGAIKFTTLRVLLKKSSWTQRFVLAYLALTWVSALVSPYMPETVIGVSRYEGALTITIYVLCFLLVSAFARVTGVILTALGLSVTAFGGLCIFQLAGYNPFHLYPIGYNYADAYKAYAGAYLGTTGNAGLTAAFLCVVIPILWVGFIRLKEKTRFLLLVPLVVSAFVLLKMSVMAGLVGAFAGGVLMFPVVIPMPPKQRKIVLGILLFVVVLAIVCVYLFDFGDGFLHEVHRIFHGDWNMTFGSGRIYIWESVLKLVPSRPWFGSGPDTMLYAGIEPFRRYDEVLGMVIVSQIDVAHNEYLNILFHQGVFALAAYLLALGSAAYKWVRNSAADPVCAMLGGAVLCYCIQAFFSFSMCITAPYFWLALGLLENRAANRDEERKLCGKN